MARKKPALDLYALDPSAKRAMEAEDRFKADLRTKNKFRARPQTGATASAPRRGGIERTADRLAAFGVPLSVTEAIKDVDRNLLGFDETAQSIRNIQSGDAGAGDYLNVALSAPVLGGAIARPLEVAAGKLGRGAMNLGRRAMGTRAGRYLTEARPLLDNADDAIETAFTVTPGAQRRITNQRPVVRGLPAPEQRLGLPAPGPGLPPLAVKRKGGQWWPDANIGDGFGEGRNYSPEFAVNRIINNQFVGDLNPEEQALRDWFAKAAPRYLKNELGTPEDPLMRLAEQGNLHLADTSPNIWARRSRMSLYDEPIGYFTVPAHESEKTPGLELGELLGGPDMQESKQLLAAAPWLSKAPATDKLYGLTQGAPEQLGFHHLLDEMGNALNPQSGLPPELLLDPKSLQRMGLAQASERVGRINQWRADQALQAKLNAVDNPATYTFKEYPENNPRGLRWVELRKPESDNAPEGALEQALKYEGDTMGHCVGGYCDDVLQGRSRIFSLRDAKGEPHVTIETAPQRLGLSYEQLRAFKDQAEQEARGMDFDSDEAWEDFIMDRRDQLKAQWVKDQGINAPQNIVQIKGKQNRAPKDDYLPFVQDFVKSGQWGNVGDLGNTGLVKLPDGRYITAQQAEEAIAAIPETTTMQRAYGSREMVPTRRVYDPSNLDYLDPEEWRGIAPYFEGYARGGRALAAKPCSCDHSLSVR